jgi:hypothetical protein
MAGWAAVAISTVLAIGILVIAVTANGAEAVLKVGWLALWFIAIGWSVGAVLVNAYPTVLIDDDHLTISVFLLMKAKVKWCHVLGVRSLRFPFQGIAVQARRITLVHSLIGWMYLRSFQPCFLIRPEIEGYEELLHAIQQKLEVKHHRASD